MLDRSLEKKNVKIDDIYGNTYSGEVLDYIFPEDNDPEGVAGIDIMTFDREIVGLNEPDIKQIKILK